MFTDDQATPIRLEMLIEVLRRSERPLPREELVGLLQPEVLVEGKADFKAAKATLRAAVELRLVKELESGVSLAPNARGAQSPRTVILEALDEVVLCATEVEKYFALYYSYYLGLGKEAERRGGPEDFNRDVFDDEAQKDRFNSTKLDGLNRWFYYTGLGWYDQAKTFHANPYERVHRALPKMFKARKPLPARDFMVALGKACPELDGGELFQKANRKQPPDERTCTLGLSQALIELHLDGIVRLNCPADNDGWSVGVAEPLAADGFVSNRFVSVELREGK